MSDELKLLSDKLVERSFTRPKGASRDIYVWKTLNGFGVCKLESFPGAGHNYHVILSSIYDYYKKNPQVNVKEIFEEGLNFSIEHLATVKNLSMIVNYIDAQLDNEDKKIAPFEIDAAAILKNLKSRLNSGYDFRDYETLIEQYEKSNDYLNEKYDHKTL